MSDEQVIKLIISEVLKRIDSQKTGNTPKGERVLYCNYSNRHCHISSEDLEALFGRGYQLTRMKDLIQPGEFATKEIITIVGPTGETLPVRILGPVRPHTQVEISRSDSFALNIPDVPVRESGDIGGTPGFVLVGPAGAVTKKEGLIVAKRHVHFTPEDAEYFGVKDKEIIRVRVKTPDRTVVFEDVVARVKSTYALEMHIDVDEANSAGAGQMTPAQIIKD